MLDESGILKALTGATKRALIDFAQTIRFRLCCSATPAPNDHMELGNHAEFLGVMSSNEMLSRFFVNDTSTASQVWRLKGHAKEAFWDWIATWAFGVTKPSDFGYSDARLRASAPRRDQTRRRCGYHQGSRRRAVPDRGCRLNGPAPRERLTLDERVAKVAEVVHGQPGERWIVWCHANVEADALAEAIPDAVEVRGNMPADLKERRIVDFVEERSRILLTKPRIAAWGLNLQNCARMAFVGISFSFEESYQAIRRCWRFGQARSRGACRGAADRGRCMGYGHAQAAPA